MPPFGFISTTRTWRRTNIHLHLQIPSESVHFVPPGLLESSLSSELYSIFDIYFTEEFFVHRSRANAHIFTCDEPNAADLWADALYYHSERRSRFHHFFLRIQNRWSSLVQTFSREFIPPSLPRVERIIYSRLELVFELFLLSQSRLGTTIISLVSFRVNTSTSSWAHARPFQIT